MGWDWDEIFTTIGTVAGALLSFAAFRSIIVMDRDEAMRAISSKVTFLTTRQLDDYEIEFLKHSLTLIDQHERIRAMELYAWLKMTELAHYESFRGFGTPGDKLS